MEYPKIETLFDRNDDFTVDPTRLRLPEFALVNTWLATEKIDGTNIRIRFDGAEVACYGRTDNAQLPPELLSTLRSTFTPEAFRQAFSDPSQVWLFGEGYGPKIQSGGDYRADPGFRLFDVRVGDWWLNWRDVEDVASKMGVAAVPTIEAPSIEHLVSLVQGGQQSIVATEDGGVGRIWEGIVCRTEPLLFTRKGERLMWKLKGKDFKAGKR